MLIDRAERRLNNLGYFKKVKITNEPGSRPDRVIVVVNVEDQPTGSLSLSGGYSTSDGFIADVSVTETNFMGRGQFVRLGVSEGQYSRGVTFSFTEPYFLGNRIAAGFDLYAKQSNAMAILLLQQLHDWRDVALWFAHHRRADVLAKILALPQRHLHSQQFSAALQRLYLPGLGHDAGIPLGNALYLLELLDQWRGLFGAQGGARPLRDLDVRLYTELQYA